MKLIKLSSDHYIIVDDSEIKIDDYFYNGKAVAKMCNQWMITFTAMDEIKCKKITYSTQPIERSYNSTSSGFNMMQMSSDIELVYDKIQPLSLSEVEELLGEVDVEKKSYAFIKKVEGSEEHRLTYIDGYRESLEDNKDRKYTEEDMRKMFDMGEGLSSFNDSDDNKFRYALSLVQPKPQWDVEFVNGKIKLV